MSYFCIVKFLDRNKKSVVRSSDVKDFHPTHPQDFDSKKIYSVVWQEPDGSFDGSYDAQMLCQAATLQELKTKAVPSLMTRMPANYERFFTLEKPEKKKTDNGRRGKRSSNPPKLFTLEEAQSKKSSIVTSKRKAPSANHQFNAKRKRMLDFVSEMKVGCQSGGNNIIPTEIVKPSSPKGQKTATTEDTFSQDFGNENTQKISEVIDDNSSQDFKLDSILDKIEKSDVEDSQDTTEMGSDDTNFDFNTLLPDTEPTSDFNREEDLSSNSSHYSSDLLSGSEDEVAKLMKAMDILKEKLKLQSKEMKQAKSDHAVQIQSLEEKHDKALCLLRTSVKVADNARIQQYAELVQVRKDNATLMEEKSRLTSENKELKSQAERKQNETEGSILEENKKLREVNKKLRSLVKNAQDLLAAGLLKFSIEGSTPVVRHLDFATPAKSTANGLMSPPTSCRSSASGSGHKSGGNEISSLSSIASASSSASGHSPKTTPPASRSHGSGTKKKSPAVVGGLEKTEIAEIAEKVRKDITGQQPLEQNAAGQVVIGGGLAILKCQWDHIKIQKKDSFFVKKLGHSTYGPSGLKERTVGQPEISSKKQATPSKVDAIVACLRGRLLAQNMNPTDAKDGSEAARSILAEKMQDAARKRDPSKRRDQE